MPGEAPGGDRGHVTPLPGTNAGPVIDRLWARAPRGGGLVPSRPAPTGYRQWPTRRLGAMLGAVPGWFPFAALAAIWAGAVMYGARRAHRARLRGARRKSDKMRDQARPEAVGYELDRETLTPTRRVIDTSAPGDYGADPIGDGLFRMVPSGDIVDFEERNRRLKRPPLRGGSRQITDVAALRKRLAALSKRAFKEFSEAADSRDIDDQFLKLRRKLDEISRDSSGFFPEANDMTDEALRSLIAAREAAKVAYREDLDARRRDAIDEDRAARRRARPWEFSGGRRRLAPPAPPVSPERAFDPEVLLPQIDKQIEEGGGWANMKRLPGGADAIWELIDRGILEEDGGFVRRRRA